ncbi:MAG: glycosyl hydrolase 2 galactose-binding domain-containing protein [Bryobacteraceae bacterium]
MIASAMAARGGVAVEIPIAAGWEMASAPGPEMPATFVPAYVPGTVASALRDRQMWRMGDGVHFDASHHWFRCRFDAEPAAPGEEIALCFGGIATLAEVWLNGGKILCSDSMFAMHRVNVSTLLRERNEVLIQCLPLSAALREQRGRQPAARWRTRVVHEQQLRWFRATLLGRAPGFSPEPEPVGPWRPVWLERRRHIALDRWSREIRMEGSTGVVEVNLRLRILDAKPRSGRIFVGEESAALAFQDSSDGIHARGVVRIRNAACWWPHTHGEPALYPVRAEIECAGGFAAIFADVPIGFRSLEAGNPDFELRVNGKRVFCRGVVWTPLDLVSLAASTEALRERLRLLRDGGFNLIRLVGTTTYESEDFHRLCDELGLLVWQDMMFANMDYPFEDPEFHRTACDEAEAELSRVARNPSTAVICGNSEVEQQAAMFGLDPAIGRGSFFGDELPRIAVRCCPGVPYIPSAPYGGDLPFRANFGVANYFGVGAYMRPLDDARRSGVKFASECLAFSNVPEAIDPMWKRGIPRDPGAGWDFEDVRDFYLKLLYGVDSLALRYSDAGRYWELSRMVSGEVMAEVFGEWRRAASSCAGGIVLWAGDLEPGAGWGILDSDGRPKAAYWFLKRALAPRTLWMTNEGLNGVDVHVANDSPAELEACLRVALYRLGEQKVAGAEKKMAIPPRETTMVGVEQMLGRFVDASYAYRFGPPGHDLIVSSLHTHSGGIPFAQSFHFPAGRSAQRLPIVELGIEAACNALEVTIGAQRFVWGVRVAAEGFMPGDAYFGLEPGCKRRIVLTPVRARAGIQGADSRPAPVITAVNAEGRLRL